MNPGSQNHLADASFAYIGGSGGIGDQTMLKAKKSSRKITRSGTRVLDEAKLFGMVAQGHSLADVGREFRIPKSAVLACLARRKK